MSPTEYILLCALAFFVSFAFAVVLGVLAVDDFTDKEGGCSGPPSLSLEGGIEMEKRERGEDVPKEH